MRWDADNPLILVPGADAILATDHPLDVLRQIERCDSTLAGFFSYDLGRYFEELPAVARDDLGLPMIAMAPIGMKPRGLPRAAGSLERAGQVPRLHCDVIPSTFTRDAYLRAVQRCLDFIAAGDVFQINLSQRFTAPLTREPIDIFEHLQQHFPARYPAYIDFGTFQIISNSPELFLKVDRLPDGSRRIINRPIKGTRPNAPGMAQELKTSIKDRAELAMIVDLQRNDLGRICEIGTVRVTEPRVIEAHPTVIHGVATVEGILREGVTLTDILRATFPCGSVTGCPKIRAMQIIDELEPVRRGVYCGAIGWIAPDGTMELSVAIRTMTVLNGQVHIPVGGGIVADSMPDDEYDETVVKARAMFAAAGVEGVSNVE